MFETTLKEQLQRIFDLDKATFDAPSESQEQECLFIEISKSRNTIKDGLQVARVTGKIRVFGNSEKLPYGYFSKCIQEADAADTLPFFFFEFEENAGSYRNIAERSVSFVYFFNSQYNPRLGTITSINISEVSE